MLRSIGWSALVVVACLSPIISGVSSAWAGDWESILVAPPKDDSSWDPGRFVPSARQMVYQENQVGAFVHFLLATYAVTDAEYQAALHPSHGPDIAKDRFNPSQLDAEQWVLAAKSLGAKHLVFTAKHHGGFCLWPTKTTDYCVRNTPWKNGKGDVVREVAAACKKHGMPLGIYCSPADKHYGCVANPHDGFKLQGDREAYFRVYREQLRELLTNYGDVVIVWLDAYFDPFGPNVCDGSGKKIGSGPYEAAIVSLVRSLQPKAVILRYATAQSDVRAVGNEDGTAPYPIWNAVRKGDGVKYKELAPDAEGWFLHESDMHPRPEWVWRPHSDAQLLSVDRFMKAYYSSIGAGANILVNLTPDTRGLIPEAEVKRVAEFGAAICRCFGTPVARTESSKGWVEPGILELDLGRATNVIHVVLEEDIAFGQHVLQYAVDAKVGGQWKQVAQGESIGRKRIHRLETPVSTDKLRLRIVKAYAIPQIRELAAYDVLTGQ